MFQWSIDIWYHFITQPWSMDTKLATCLRANGESSSLGGWPCQWPSRIHPASGWVSRQRRYPTRAGPLSTPWRGIAERALSSQSKRQFFWSNRSEEVRVDRTEMPRWPVHRWRLTIMTCIHFSYWTTNCEQSTGIITYQILWLMGYCDYIFCPCPTQAKRPNWELGSRRVL